jgi:hypothetical protein
LEYSVNWEKETAGNRRRQLPRTHRMLKIFFFFKSVLRLLY